MNPYDLEDRHLINVAGSANTCPFVSLCWLPRFIFGRRQLPDDPVWPQGAQRILWTLLVNGSDQVLSWVLRHNLKQA